MSLDFSFSVGAACLKKFSSSTFKSVLESSGLAASAGFSCGAEKKLENMSSLAGFSSDLTVSKPKRSVEPFEVLLVSS